MQQQRLLVLHDLDTRIAQARRQLSQLPEHQEAVELEERITLLKPAFKEAQRGKEELDTEIARIESDLVLVRDRKKRDQERLSGDVSAKEAAALQEEIVALDNRRDALEDRQLVLMEELESATEIFDSKLNEIQEIEGERAKIGDKIAAAEAQTKQNIEEISNERANVSAEITTELRELYEKLRERTGIGAARLRGNVSEASNMALGPAELQELLKVEPDELLFCPHTGAILVREESE